MSRSIDEHRGRFGIGDDRQPAAALEVEVAENAKARTPSIADARSRPWRA